MISLYFCVISILSSPLTSNITLILTAIIVFWYTWETSKIRKQSSAFEDPLIILHYKQDDSGNISNLRVKNMGRSVALEVSFWAGNKALFEGVLKKESRKNIKNSNTTISFMKPEEEIDIGYLSEVLYDEDFIDTKEFCIKCKNSAGKKISIKYRIHRKEDKKSKSEGFDFLEFLNGTIY